MDDLFSAVAVGFLGLGAVFMIVEVALSFLKKSATAGAGDNVD